MSPVLAQYAKLANDVMVAGVMDELITADFLTAHLMFETMEGNSLLYNRELALPTTSTFQVGSTWTDSDATYTQKSATLKIVGSQSALDLYVRDTRSNVQSQEAVHHAGMLKSFSRKIAQYVIQGEPENVSTEFEGLDSLVRSETRMMAMDDGNVDGPGTAETELTVDRMEAMIDTIDDGKSKPDALIMNNTMWRKLTSLSRVAGSGIQLGTIEQFGVRVNTYDSIPVIRTNWITDAEQYNDSSTWPSSTATTLFAVKFGKEKQGYTLLHNGPVLTPQIQDLGIKFDKNERDYRIVGYLAAVTYSSKMVAALGGIDSAA